MKKTIVKTQQPVATQPEIESDLLEKALIQGDIAGLNPAQKVEYYMALCKSLDLNPLTRPFEYLTLDGKVVLYARKDCTDQLRKKEGITITVKSRVTEDGVHVVTVAGKNAAGREDEAIGTAAMDEPEFVLEWSKTERGKKEWVKNPKSGSKLSPEKRGLALMKAETKAKRRVTLSLGGLGMMDETEIDDAMRHDIPAAIEQQQADVKQLADKADTAKVAEIEKAGGKVVEVVSSTTPAKGDWREVVCHVGMANGPLLEKKLGELPPALISWLRFKWLPTAGKSAKDKALAAAINEIPEAGEAPKPPPDAQTTVPPTQNEPQPAKNRKAAPPDEPSPPPDWRAVKVHIGKKDGKPSSLTGKTLGELSDEHLQNCFAYGIPRIKTDTAADKAFIGGVLAACEEKNLLTPDIHRQAIVTRFSDLGITPEKFDKAMVAGGIFQDKDKLETVSVEMLKYIGDNWSDVAKALEEKK